MNIKQKAAVIKVKPLLYEQVLTPNNGTMDMGG